VFKSPKKLRDRDKNFVITSEPPNGGKERKMGGEGKVLGREGPFYNNWFGRFPKGWVVLPFHVLRN